MANSKLSEAMKGNRNAAKDYVSKSALQGARVGAKIGGALESAEMQTKGAYQGAKIGYKVGSVFSTKQGLKSAYGGATTGLKAGGLLAAVSPVGEIKGAIVGAKAVATATSVGREVKAAGNDMANSAKASYTGVKEKARAQYLMQTHPHAVVPTAFRNASNSITQNVQSVNDAIARKYKAMSR
jgi:hypothetical protein